MQPRAVGASSRYQTLDALRGVAAVGVMLFHITGRRLFAQGFLAVDFFFILSGFVIAHAYGEKLRSGLSFGEFMIRRVIRLYPLVILGALVGILDYRLQPISQHLGGAGWLYLFGCNAALIPQIATAAADPHTFPLNTVMWSLFFEVAANVVYGLFIFRFRPLVALAVSVAGLVAIILIGKLGGSLTTDFWTGFPRVTFAFFAGVGMYELLKRSGRTAPRIGTLPLSITLLALFAIPGDLTGLGNAPAFAVMLIIIYVGSAPTKQGPMLHTVDNWLGRLSYPLYALHFPIFKLIQHFWPARSVLLDSNVSIQWAVICLAAIIAAVVALKLYDEPLRDYLTGRMKRPVQPDAVTGPRRS